MSPLIKPMIFGGVRHLMGLASGAAIGAGYGTAELWVSITGGVIGIVTIILSMINKKNAKKAIDNAGQVDPSKYDPNDPYKNVNRVGGY